MTVLLEAQKVSLESIGMNTEIIVRHFFLLKNVALC